MADSISIEGLASEALRYEAVDYADTTFLSYAEKIASDYNFIIRDLVLPQLSELNGLKLRELQVLVCVYFFTVPISPFQVAELLRINPSTVSRAVYKLENDGKIKRQNRDKDKRSHRLKLTDAGTKLAKQFTETVNREFKKLEAQLLYGLSDEDKTMFLNVMVKISRRAQAMKIIADG